MTDRDENAAPGRLRTCRSCSAAVFSPGLDTCIACLCAEAGVTYAQLNRWCTVGYLRPGRTERARYYSAGQGCPRVWTPEELRVLRLMGRLVGAGLSPEVAATVARNGWERSQIAPGVWLEIEGEAAGDAEG